MTSEHRPVVLVVDDEADIRHLLAECLRPTGMVVIEASTGEEALDALEEAVVDCVVLDRMLPGMSGDDVLRTIRTSRMHARLPVLMLTALDQRQDRLDGFDEGADDYLVKPFDPDELVARVRAHLRSRAGWAQVVSLEVERRNVLTSVARAAAKSGADAYELAEQLCTELLRLPEVAGAELIETIGKGAVVLGGNGDRPVRRLAVDSSASPHQVIALRALGGPWIERVANGDQTQMVAGAPIVVADRTIAILLVTSRPALSPSERDRTLSVAIDFAALTAGVLGPALEDSAARMTAYQRYIDLVDSGMFHTVFQPIVDLFSGEPVGYEALTRFDGGHDTEQTFVNAAAVDAGHHVELRTMEAALRSSVDLAEGTWLSLNATPSLITQSDLLPDLLRRYDDRQLIIELSELEPVGDYDRLHRAVRGLGASIQLSIDDAGSGFSSLAHVLRLQADHVKLDQSWIRNIDSAPPQKALVAGVQNFASETGAVIVAEGIETEAELETVRALGIKLGQGYLLGRPTAVMPNRRVG